MMLYGVYMKKDLSRIEQIIGEIAIEAGERVLAERMHVVVGEKAPGDYLTSADTASDELIRKRLSEHFGDMPIVSEEEPFDGSLPPECFVVDPLDGTTNFTRGLNHFCVAIAYRAGDETLCAATYDPTGRRLFTASPERGTRCNNTIVSVSNRPLRDSILALEHGARGSVRHDDDIDLFARASKIALDVRNPGAHALTAALVAAGHLDGMVQFGGPKLWDYVGGRLMVKLAGGEVMTTRGTQAGPDDADSILCGKTIYHELLALAQA